MPPSILAKSAQGATFLILLQIVSRALTFVVNQVLLRYSSPQILGVATQLELFSVSTLYFSRESIRVALQRQRSDEEPKKPVRDKSNGRDHQGSPSAQEDQSIQEVVNLSYVAIVLGITLTVLFGWLYIRNADQEVLSTQYLHESLILYALATLLELFHEPMFAIAQQQMLYGTRASVEMQATFTRCIITCSTAIWANIFYIDLGVLPFAMGQLSYAILLLVGYIYRLSPIYRPKSISLLPHPLPSSRTQLPHPLVKLSIILYSQSLFKQLLTSGDAYLVALLTTLSSQGAYALASNYGGLLPRILFQPIEESSRSLFARLLLPLNRTPSQHQKINTHSLNQAIT